MLFRRKQPEPPELTSEGFARWLRAGRPPFAFFAGLSELEQEALAGIGDALEQDRIEALALALANPQALATGAEARDAAGGDADAEESLALKLATGLIRKIGAAAKANAAPAAPTAPAQPVPETPTTFAGLGDRKVEDVGEAARARPKLWGQEPDAVAK